jgi:hypothetical protein
MYKRDRLRTSINVLGDAYGCGIVEHLSRNELRKLDEEAENEFNKIVAAQQQGASILNDDTLIISSTNPNDTPTINTDFVDERSRMVNSSSQQFNEFRKFDARRPSNRSQISFNGGCVIPEEHADTPSIVVMDAVRRRSRAMLFSSKIPYSVYSMPHISNYANNNANTSHYSNLNEKASPQGVNSDSNV